MNEGQNGSEVGEDDRQYDWSEQNGDPPAF